jgi:hypothetical protein
MTTEEDESQTLIVRLFYELASIESCNQDYLSHEHRKEIDSAAYLIRLERREEILRFLGTTMGRA